MKNIQFNYHLTNLSSHDKKYINKKTKKIKNVFSNLEVNQPQLYKIIDQSAKQAIKDNGYITVRFLAGAPEHDKKFEAKWSSDQKIITINVDSCKHNMDLTTFLLFELNNAGNFALDMLQAHDFQDKHQYVETMELLESLTIIKTEQSMLS